MKNHRQVTALFRTFSRFSAPALLLAFAGFAAHCAELRASTIAAGTYHTCALGSAGEVLCWGSNSDGQLGDGSNTLQSAAPGLVKGLPSGVKALALGGKHSCALTDAGKVLCWGDQSNGQLGQAETFKGKNEAIEVQGLPAAVRAVSAGYEHNCALTAAGNVMCWGRNGEGQLGDNSGIQRNLPVKVANLQGNVAAVTAGGRHTCALTTAGAVLCWGDNTDGNLGIGSTQSNHTTPVPVPGLGSGVTTIAAGSNHTCALLESGAVRCWGGNGWGQLGDGGAGAHLGPVDVQGLGAGVTFLAAGGSNTCVLDGIGKTVCWGPSYYDIPGRMRPVPLDGLASGVSTIAVGSGHICAVVQGGAVKCMGYNHNNQAGDVCSEACPSARSLTHPVEPPQAVSFGKKDACSIGASGRLSCWGERWERDKAPSFFDGSGRTKSVKTLALSDAHACVLTGDGAVNCWGTNFNGRLGNPAVSTHSASPVEPVGLGRDVAAVVVDGSRTCALTGAGGVKCWGVEFTSQISCYKWSCSYPPAIPSPTDVPGMTAGVTAIAMNGSGVYALTANGTVLCYGYRCPSGGGARLVDKAVVVDGLSGVKAITANGTLACALSTTVKCWRAEESSFPSTTLFDTLPTEVAGLVGPPTAIASGANHACALLADGTVQCWGSNSDGALGDNTTVSRPDAVKVSGLPGPVTAIFAGESNTCAVLAAGGATCWGINKEGQLGFSSKKVVTPRTVSSPSATCSAGAAPLELKVGEASILSATCSPDTKRILWFEEGREDIALAPGQPVKPVFSTTYVARGANDDGVGPTRAMVTITVADSAQFTGEREYFWLGRSTSGIHVHGGSYDTSHTFPSLKRLRFIGTGYYTGYAVGHSAFEIDGVPGKVQRLYRAALPPASMKTPDERLPSFTSRSEAQNFLLYKRLGITAIESRGWTLERVAQSFLYLPEFEKRYGVMDDRQFVERIHMNTLYRAPSAETVAFYVDGLASGAFTRAKVLMGFAETPENPMLATVANLEEVRY